MINYKGAYLTERCNEIKPSVAEKKIMKVLNSSNIEYFREVSFIGLLSNKGFPLFFDFVIPSLNIIIEYDGTHHLTDEQIKENDEIKNLFAKNKNIKLHRLNAKDWPKLSRLVGKLIMKKVKIKESKPNKGKKHKRKLTQEEVKERMLRGQQKVKERMERNKNRQQEIDKKNKTVGNFKNTIRPSEYIKPFLRFVIP